MTPQQQHAIATIASANPMTNQMAMAVSMPINMSMPLPVPIQHGYAIYTHPPLPNSSASGSSHASPSSSYMSNNSAFLGGGGSPAGEPYEQQPSGGIAYTSTSTCNSTIQSRQSASAIAMKGYEETQSYATEDSESTAMLSGDFDFFDSEVKKSLLKLFLLKYAFISLLLVSFKQVGFLLHSFDIPYSLPNILYFYNTVCVFRLCRNC